MDSDIFQLLLSFTKVNILQHIKQWLPSLTERLHVLIEVLAVHQLPRSAESFSHCCRCCRSASASRCHTGSHFPWIKSCSAGTRPPLGVTTVTGGGDLSGAKSRLDVPERVKAVIGQNVMCASHITDKGGTFKRGRADPEPGRSDVISRTRSQKLKDLQTFSCGQSSHFIRIRFNTMIHCN